MFLELLSGLTVEYRIQMLSGDWNTKLLPEASQTGKSKVFRKKTYAGNLKPQKFPDIDLYRPKFFKSFLFKYFNYSRKKVFAMGILEDHFYAMEN